MRRRITSRGAFGAAATPRQVGHNLPTLLVGQLGPRRHPLGEGAVFQHPEQRTWGGARHNFRAQSRSAATTLALLAVASGAVPPVQFGAGLHSFTTAFVGID